MYFIVKRFVARTFIALFGQPVVYVLGLLAKSQISPNRLVRSLGCLPFQFVDVLLGENVQRFIAHVANRKSRPRQSGSIQNYRLRSYIYLVLAKIDVLVPPSFTPHSFRVALSKEIRFDQESQYALAHKLLNAGKLDLACEAFEDLLEKSADKLALERRLQLLRDTGIAFFLIGKIERANHYWGKAGGLRCLLLGEEHGPIYRIIGNSWFAAIGHVAMLDFYVKYNKLYRGKDIRVVVQQNLSTVPGSYLCERMAETGIEFLKIGQLASDYDQWAARHGKRLWSELTAVDRFALIDDFWEFEFPDGQVLGYTHATDRIQKDWEQQQRPPLLTVSEGEKVFLHRALRTLGLPEKAWYVCLHVREPGFHRNWNTLYPSMRDANVEDYLPAIKLIVESGGWVIRMGDPSMKRLPPMRGLIDYAHSNFKTPKADILITLGCRFFLGTNSGFATIPAIYGVRCVFSNWLPIGLPLWPSQDLMLPKMFWNEKLERYLTLEEVFSSGLAFIQNWSDLPEGISLRDNTPEEILALTEEALGIAPEVSVEKLSEVRTHYRQIAEQHNSYVGSTLAASFIRLNRF